MAMQNTYNHEAVSSPSIYLRLDKWPWSITEYYAVSSESSEYLATRVQRALEARGDGAQQKRGPLGGREFTIAQRKGTDATGVEYESERLRVILRLR